jgi:uncharacterized protein YeaO (DUF488 family)
LDIRTKRIYEAKDSADGYRLLVDRIWPRGVSKERAGLDDWMPEIGPSTELRRWFGHDPARWQEFKRRYAAELDASQHMVSEIAARARKGPVTLLYSAKDAEHNQAVALAEYLVTKRD